MCKRPTGSFTESENVSDDSTEAYIQIVTSGGRKIPVHTNILASSSTVFESIIAKPFKKNRNSERTMPILGVPCDAVVVFVRYLYSNKCTAEDMEKYGIHLLAVSHVYLVRQLKSRCTKALIQQLRIENVTDLLQLARLCDAPDLYLKCMKLVSYNFKKVQKTEGWKFIHHNDPFLELEILQFIDETESRKKRSRKHMKEQSLYFQLSEAMECLEHICSEGCISVGPACNYDKDKELELGSERTRKNYRRRAPCSKFSICLGLQVSIQHFASCEKRRVVNGGCVRCNRMWQLFKLHSSICDHSPDDHSTCKVPLCRRFKMKSGEEVMNKNEKDGIRWEVLVKKVRLAKVAASCLLKILPKRKRLEEPSSCGEANNINDNHHDYYVLRNLAIC